jgi:hypothetical protein
MILEMVRDRPGLVRLGIAFWHYIAIQIGLGFSLRTLSQVNNHRYLIREFRRIN